MEKHFTMNSVLRNSSIQETSKLNPRLVNRVVDRALCKPMKSCFDKELPFLHLCSHQPAIPVENVDVVRRPLAFGRWALPKLYRELHSSDRIVRLQAIDSFCDICHDPEKVFEAIRLKFVPRLGNLLMRSKVPFQERILIALRIIASQALGREEIMNRPVLINGFKELLASNSVNIRCKTAAVIEKLTFSLQCACVLTEEGYVPTIIQYVTVDDAEVIKYHLRSLERLFTNISGQEEGLFYEAITKMVFLLEYPDPSIISLASNCLAMLVSHPDGKKIAVQDELLLKLTELLLHEDREVYTSAAMVIMFATHTVKSKHQAAYIPGLAERLLQVCNDFNHPPAQMFAMKALCNMVEHPVIRELMVNKYMNDLKCIRICDNPELKRYKQILLNLVKWKPWL